MSFVGTAGGGVPPFTYEWDFGDGTSHETGGAATHTYAGPGTFTYTLTVTDGSATGANRNGKVDPSAPPNGHGYPVCLIAVPAERFGVGFPERGDHRRGRSAVPTTTFKSSTLLEAGQGSRLKALLPKGRSVTVRVTNPDGGQASMTYAR